MEEYLIECVQEKTDFCFSFKEIPNPDFVKRFMTRYENEFIKFDTLKDIAKGKNMDSEEDRVLERQYMLNDNLGRQ